MCVNEETVLICTCVWVTSCRHTNPVSKYSQRVLCEFPYLICFDDYVLQTQQEFICVLQNPKINYRIKTSPSQGLNQNHAVLVYNLLKICLNSIFTSTSRSSRPFLLKFDMHFSTFTSCYMPHPSHSPSFVHPIMMLLSSYTNPKRGKNYFLQTCSTLLEVLPLYPRQNSAH